MGIVLYWLEAVWSRWLHKAFKLETNGSGPRLVKAALCREYIGHGHYNASPGSFFVASAGVLAEVV